MFQHSFVRTGLVLTCLGGAMLCPLSGAFAQTSETLEPEPVEVEAAVPDAAAPLDDFTQRSVLNERQVLPYAPVREADIMWERRIWRVIDVREKMNQPFKAPESPLFGLLADAVLSGDLKVYSTENDRFTKALKPQDVREMLFSRDTVMILGGPDFTEEQIRIVENQLDYEKIKRFRVKEAWYFDASTASLKVRILGIAPMVDEIDEEGNFKYERPLFWVHYPTARPLLARHKAILSGGNYASTTSWEDLFESRRFASTIYKQNNTNDLRIQDYKEGVDQLLEARKIEAELFAWEHDMWSY